MGVTKHIPAAIHNIAPASANASLQEVGEWARQRTAQVWPTELSSNVSQSGFSMRELRLHSVLSKMVKGLLPRPMGPRISLAPPGSEVRDCG